MNQCISAITRMFFILGALLNVFFVEHSYAFDNSLQQSVAKLKYKNELDLATSQAQEFKKLNKIELRHI